MRTTIRLDDALLRKAKALAAATGRPLNDFIADAVRAAVASRPPDPAATPLPTFRGTGLQSGVDLDNAASLLDLVEGDPAVYRIEHSRTIDRSRPKAAKAAKVAERSKKRPTRE